MMTNRQRYQIELSLYRQQVEHYQDLIARFRHYGILWQLCLEHAQRGVAFYENLLKLGATNDNHPDNA